MTENEAKELVKKLRNKAELFKNSGFAVDGIVKSFEDSANAIETLSEAIQQYRAIGTVEEFKALKEKNEPKKVLDFQANKMQSFCEDDFGRDIPCMTNVFQFNCPSCNRKIASRFKVERCPNCKQELNW